MFNVLETNFETKPLLSFLSLTLSPPYLLTEHNSIPKNMLWPKNQNPSSTGEAHRLQRMTCVYPCIAVALPAAEALLVVSPACPLTALSWNHLTVILGPFAVFFLAGDPFRFCSTPFAPKHKSSRLIHTLLLGLMDQFMAFLDDFTGADSAHVLSVSPTSNRMTWDTRENCYPKQPYRNSCLLILTWCCRYSLLPRFSASLLCFL